MQAAEHRDNARAWLDLAAKIALVGAFAAYAGRRDQELTATVQAVAELRAVAADLASGIAVTQARIEALEHRR